MTTLIITAGLSSPSSTRLLADRFADELTSAGRAARVVELRPLAHAITDAMLTGFASGDLAELIEDVRRAEALVLVTPVFSASYSGLFKSFLDILEPGLLDGMPVLLAATGGTSRHSLVIDHALRPLMAYLRAVPMPTGVFAATDDFASDDLGRRIHRATGELLSQLGGTPAQRPPSGPVFDEGDAGFADFESLLKR